MKERKESYFEEIYSPFLMPPGVKITPLAVISNT